VIGGQRPSPSRAPQGALDRAGAHGSRSPPARRWSGIRLSKAKAAPGRLCGEQTEDLRSIAGKRRRKRRFLSPPLARGRPARECQGSAKEGRPKKGRERTGGGLRGLEGLACQDENPAGRVPDPDRSLIVGFRKEEAVKAKDGKRDRRREREQSARVFGPERQAFRRRRHSRSAERRGPQVLLPDGIGEMLGRPGSRLKPTRRLSGRARIEKRRDVPRNAPKLIEHRQNPGSAQWGSAAMPGPISRWGARGHGGRRP
jgi:hypothetical protein